MTVYLASLLPIFFTNEDVYNNANIIFPFFYAPIFIIVSIFCFVAGNFFGKLLFPKKNQVIIKESLGDFNIWLSYFLCMLGVTVSYLYIISSGITIEEYFVRIILTESAGLYEGGNKRVLINGDDGGLPGVIKMFNILPISIYLTTFYLLNFSVVVNKKRLQMLNTFALICSIVRTLFLLDRLALLPILVCNLYLIIEKRTVLKKINIALFIVVVGAFNFITQQRGYSNIFEGFINYLHSHLLNLEILLRTFEKHNYWGKNSLFSAIHYSIYHDFFGGTIEIDTYSFGDNPAQNFISFAYMDFGYFTFFIFLLLGIIVYWIDIQFNNSSNNVIKFFYFLLLSNFISFLIVPSHTGIEFWLSMLVLIYFSFYSSCRKKDNLHKCTNNSK